MRPLEPPDLHGVWATLLLPLEPDGRISLPRLADQLDVLLASGLDGVYAHGTAGEFHTLSEDEYAMVNAVLVERCERAGAAFQIGAAHPAAPSMLARIRQAAALEPGAIQVILPDWVPMNDDEVRRYLVGAAEAAGGVPLVLYNPRHAKTPITPELMTRIVAEVPIVGVKLADGDDAWFAAMTAALARRALFVPGHRLASGIRRGAQGSYSNVAAMSPRGAVAWYRLMADDLDAALDVEARLAVLFGRQVAPLQARGMSDPALDKFLAAVGDWAEIGLATRWPASAVSATAVAAARADAHRLVPELFPTT